MHKNLVQTLCAAFCAILAHLSMGGGGMSIAARNILGFAEGGTPAPAYWGLCFTAEEPNVVVNMVKQRTPTAVSLETSTDGINWTTFDSETGTTPITLANIGDKVFFRAGSSGNVSFGTSNGAYHYFTLSGLCAASGDISSILNPNASVASLNSRAFQDLFLNCANLTSAPELPATTLNSQCYRLMFSGCSSLTSAPALPALATTGTSYYSMFEYCTALKSVEISAESLSTSSCTGMFWGCTSLESLKVHFSEWVGTSAWVEDVPSTGTFYCPAALGTNSTITRGADYCPTGWTVVNI